MAPRGSLAANREELIVDQPVSAEILIVLRLLKKVDGARRIFAM